MIGNPTLQGHLQSLQGVSYFNALLSTLVTAFLIVGSLVFVFMLIAGGIQWITAGGDSKAVESASGRVRTALIGIVLLFSTFAIVTLIESIFKVSILNIDIDSLILR